MEDSEPSQAHGKSSLAILFCCFVVAARTRTDTVTAHFVLIASISSEYE